MHKVLCARTVASADAGNCRISCAQMRERECLDFTKYQCLYQYYVYRLGASLSGAIQGERYRYVTERYEKEGYCVFLKKIVPVQRSIIVSAQEIPVGRIHAAPQHGA